MQEHRNSYSIWLSFVLVAAIYVLLFLKSAGASDTGVSLKGAAGLSSLVLFTPGGSFLIWLINSSACSKRLLLELYCKPFNLRRWQDRCFSCRIRKALKKEIPISSLVTLYYPVSFPDYRMLSFQSSYYDGYYAARKPELYFPLGLLA